MRFTDNVVPFKGYEPDDSTFDHIGKPAGFVMSDVEAKRTQIEYAKIAMMEFCEKSASNAGTRKTALKWLSLFHDLARAHGDTTKENEALTATENHTLSCIQHVINSPCKRKG